MQEPTQLQTVCAIRREMLIMSGQMTVNLSYFTGHDRDTLVILQGHLKDSLRRIDQHLTLLAPEPGQYTVSAAFGSGIDSQSQTV